jgi:hypothetical protein
MEYRTHSAPSSQSKCTSTYVLDELARLRVVHATRDGGNRDVLVRLVLDPDQHSVRRAIGHAYSRASAPRNLILHTGETRTAELVILLEDRNRDDLRLGRDRRYVHRLPSAAFSVTPEHYY